MSTDLEQLTADLIATSSGVPGIANRVDQQAQQAAAMGIRSLGAGPGLQQVYAQTGGTDEDDLVSTLAGKAANSGVDQMLMPMRSGS